MTTTGADETASEATAFWEERYRGQAQVWSGSVNPVLAQEVAQLTPGTALDLGCGEGGDAIWLAEHGWTVTAVDISTVALGRGADQARRRGLADRISWHHHDLATSFPDGTYDLVSAQFFQSPIELPRAEILRRAAGAVAPGGLLLVVSHAAPPSWADGHGPRHAMVSPTDDLAALALDEARWDVVRCETATRPATGPDGQPGTHVDGVVAVRRR